MQASTNKRTGTRSGSRQDRKDTAGPTAGARQDGSGKTPPDHGSVTGPGIHILSKSLTSKTMFMLGADHENRNHLVDDCLQMLRTREQVIQCITDLHAIVRAQPKYKNLDDNRFNEDSDPKEVIQWLLKKLGPLAEGSRWTVDTYEEDGKTRYCFVVWKLFPSYDVRDDHYLIPLDFLPNIKKKAPAHHDILIDLFAFMSKQLDIPLWDEHPEFKTAMDELMELKGDDFGALGKINFQQRHQYLYSKGPAAEYLKLLKQRRRKVKLSDFSRVSVFMSQRERTLRYYMSTGIDLAREKDTIANNSYVPGFLKNRDRALTAHRMSAFLWSIHQNDPVRKMVFKQWQKDEGIGNFMPIRFLVTKPGEVIEKLPDPSFPVRYCNWYRGMYSHLCSGQYRYYYYKDQLNTQQTPGEQLLIKLGK